MQPLILQSDFGLQDGAVCAMYGVAYSVCPQLTIQNLTHDITPYDIWEASYRLTQTVAYWTAGSVFVSVVDPGVGSTRRSIVAKTRDGHFIVTPDNGTLTHVKKHVGLSAVRVIDESVNRLPNSGESYTFHGRDIYAYTGARLAAGIITFEQVGPKLTRKPSSSFPQRPRRSLLTAASAERSTFSTCASALCGRISPIRCSRRWAFSSATARKFRSRTTRAFCTAIF